MTRILIITLSPALDLTIKLRTLKIGSLHLAEDIFNIAGGKGVNVAKVLADLGLTGIKLTGFLSKHNSKEFEKIFKQKSLIDHFIRFPDNNRTNIKILEQTGIITEINHNFQITKPKIKQLFNYLTNLKINKQTPVVITGRTPINFSINDFVNMLDILLAKSNKIIVDCSSEYLKIAVNKPVFLIKPNVNELQQITSNRLKTKDNIINTLKQLTINQKVQNIALSAGSESSFLANKHKILQIKPRKINNIINTVGAGDTMVAGICYGLINSFDLITSFKLGIELATQSVTQLSLDFKNFNFKQLIKQANQLTVNYL